MVILLITGPTGSGKEEFAKILKEKYNYKVLRIEKVSSIDCWNFETGGPQEECIGYLKNVCLMMIR